MSDFTYDYSQPDEYHFSMDSTLTSAFVAENMKNQNPDDHFQVLDLCAGCGVMGFELSFRNRNIKNIDFLEVQEIYKEHFEENLRRVNRSDLKTNWLQMNYEELLQPKHRHQYDLILCNPPYFQVGQGKLSPSEFKNRCRFFMDSTFPKLIEVLVHTLRPEGEAFVLIRSLKDHKLDLINEMISILPSNFSYQKVADIRGTDLFRINQIIEK